MKKILFIISLICVFCLCLNMEEPITIPEESIRFRIIANSNTIEDQNIKKAIINDLSASFLPQLEQSKSITETRQIISNNEIKLKEILDQYNIPYTINYGQNYFPSKELNGVVYPAGEYESLVISLDNANGNNWWCVMYPPLCLIEQNSNKLEQKEYKLYIKEILSRLTS